MSCIPKPPHILYLHLPNVNLFYIISQKEFLMDYTNLKSEVEQKTAATIDVLRSEFAGLRTGRASVHLLDGVRVEVYGAEMPLSQVATISAPDSATLSVTVWDPSNAAAVEKAIRDSGLGLNPMTAGGVIRLNLPPLTEERRKELVKVSGKYAEEAKISMRNIRQDAMGKIKRAKDDKEISEDDQRRYEDDLQKVFEARASEVDALAKQKEQDIMSV
jgi:ribosome recycling factor